MSTEGTIRGQWAGSRIPSAPRAEGFSSSGGLPHPEGYGSPGGNGAGDGNLAVIAYPAVLGPRSLSTSRLDANAA
jgi:hypothetical protein